MSLSSRRSVADSFSSIPMDTGTDLNLQDGSRVAVIGGGPAGSFFTYFLLRMAEEIDLELVEMERSGEGALCCGVNAWINCDLTSKKIQAARLTSAKDTGADVLLTSCPKCLIHFKCALQDEALAKRANIEIRDLSVVAAEAMVEVNDE